MAVRDDVSLDIAAALRRIDELERALAQSLSAGAAAGGTRVVQELQRGESVRIRLPAPDTSAIPPAIDRAVDQADATVAPTVDPAAASRITTTVSGSIDSADAGVAPVVDPGAASRITGTVEAAVDAAGGTVTVTADLQGTSALEAACEQAKCVDDNLKESTESADGLSGAVKGLVALLVAAGAADFFRDAINAAADLGEAISKNEVVFGPAAGEIEAWARAAAQNMGLATDEALGLASSLGVLFQATGISAAESARLSADVIGLSGDLASFANVSGGAQQVSEALSAALRGEAEPARALGIILNDEIVTRAAVREGIAQQGQELDAQQKILATYHEIMRQSVLAQGDFARTADSLPNQLRTLSAEYRDQQVAIGQELLPSASAFVQLLRDEGLPAMTALATSVIPALIGVFEALAPLLGTTTDIVVAFAPAIEAVADVLNAIPAPILQLIALTAAFYRGLLALQAGFIAARAGAAAFSVSGIGAALAAVGALIFVMQSLEQENTEAYESFLQLRDGIQDALGAATDADTVLSALTSQLESSADPEVVAAYAALGITFDEVAASATNGLSATESFNTAITGIGDQQAAVARIRELTEGNEELSDAYAVSATAFVEQRAALEQASRAQIAALVTQGLLTQEQADAATATSDASQGTTTYAAALVALLPEVEANRLEQEALALAQVESAGLTDDQANAIRELRGELDPFNESSALTAEQMARLTQELQGGSFTTREFAELAAELGVTVEALAEAEAGAAESIADSLERQRDAVQEWYDQLIAQIPDASSAFAEFNDEATIQDALDRFIEDSLAFAEAQGVLNGLLEGGFGELATFLATQPPAIIRQFAGATDAELQAFQDQVAAGNDILAVGAETAGTNAAALAGNIGTGWEDANQAIADADLAGAAQASVEDAGAAATTAAGTQQSGGAVLDAFVAGTNIGKALANGMRLQTIEVFLAGIALGEAAIRGIRIGAQIRSPSALAYDAGRQVALGYMGGFADTLDESVFQVAGVRTAGGVGGFSAAGGGSSPSSSGGGDVLVYVDGVLRDAQRVVVRERNDQVMTARRGGR